jgi:hypothetical protein
MPDLTELAWFAGLMEGEGTIGLGKNGKTWYPFLKIMMTDEDVVAKAAAIWDRPCIGPYKIGKPDQGYKDAWATQAVSWEAAASWAARISPWLGQRRLAAVANVLELAMLRKEFGTARRDQWEGQFAI